MATDEKPHAEKDAVVDVAPEGEEEDEDQPQETPRGVATARGKMMDVKRAVRHVKDEEKRYQRIGRRSITGWKARVALAGAETCAELLPKVEKLRIGGRVMDLDVEIAKGINKKCPPETLETPGPPREE